jgi:hypothetical protein
MDFDDDIIALASLGWGPDEVDALARHQMPPGAFATYRAFDANTRDLLQRLVESPSPSDLNELRNHPRRESLLEWLWSVRRS